MPIPAGINIYCTRDGNVRIKDTEVFRFLFPVPGTVYPIKNKSFMQARQTGIKPGGRWRLK
jgi:hypothetical protein